MQYGHSVFNRKWSATYFPFASDNLNALEPSTAATVKSAGVAGVRATPSKSARAITKGTRDKDFGFCKDVICFICIRTILNAVYGCTGWSVIHCFTACA